MNYDPNLTTSGRMAVQTVLLTFQQWHFRAERQVEVEGNRSGMDVLRTAVGVLYDQLYEEFEGRPQITLKNYGSDELLCTDDEQDGEDWLERMVVAASIIDINPTKEQQ